MSSIVTAATQFSLRKVQKPEEFWKRVEDLLLSAKAQRADVVVFPEYFSLSLMMAEARGRKETFKDALQSSRAHSEGVFKKSWELAQKHNIALVLGTLPWVQEGKLLNRSYFISEKGESLFQDKIFMTRFEDEVWNVVGGDRSVKVFDWRGVTCAILTCYDSEFAVLSQSLATSGVELLFVPSCTDTENGYWRVRHCCEARAIENQLYVVMSNIVEGDKDHEEIDAHHGQSAIFSPCDSGFNPDGLVALGEKNKEGICVANLDIGSLKTVRASGAVFNLRDAIRVTSVQSRKEKLK